MCVPSLTMWIASCATVQQQQPQSYPSICVHNQPCNPAEDASDDRPQDKIHPHVPSWGSLPSAPSPPGWHEGPEPGGVSHPVCIRQKVRHGARAVCGILATNVEIMRKAGRWGGQTPHLPAACRRPRATNRRRAQASGPPARFGLSTTLSVVRV